LNVPLEDLTDGAKMGRMTSRSMHLGEQPIRLLFLFTFICFCRKSRARQNLSESSSEISSAVSVRGSPFGTRKVRPCLKSNGQFGSEVARRMYQLAESERLDVGAFSVSRGTELYEGAKERSSLILLMERFASI
jgi:hypothetical protein